MKEFRVETRGEIRVAFLEVIWHYREPTTIPFMVECLDDPAPEVWQAALDGLVALASDESEAALTRALASCGGTESEQKRREWIGEALEQVRDALGDQ